MKFNKVYVYVRFSSDAQAEGNSLARQRELAQGYIAKLDVDARDVQWVEDAGTSAYSGAHLHTGELGKLLKLLEKEGAVGKLVIFESVDRASRQGSLGFFKILNMLLEAGASVYFLDQPQQPPFDRNSPAPFYMTYLSLKAEMAFAESARKSDMSKANWRKRRAMAIDEKQPYSKECPRWLKVVDGKYELIEERVESIRRVFELASKGWGKSKIVRYANSSKWPVPGKGNVWHTSLLTRLFDNRALIGEFRAHFLDEQNKVITSEPVENYFPPALKEDVFRAVAMQVNKEARFGNRKDSNSLNYLRGLAKCACGGTWRRLNKNSGKQAGYAQYSCARRVIGLTQCSNISSRNFDYSFIGVACAKIPSLLRMVEGTHHQQMTMLMDKLESVEDRINRLLDLYEQMLMPEVASRLQKARDEREELRRAIKNEELLAPPDASFDFGDALAVYLPAFLDLHGDDEAGMQAHETRLLFRARLLESVKSVSVAADRKAFTVTLATGLQFSEPIYDPSENEDDLGFGPPGDDIDADDLATLEEERTRAFKRLHRKP
ncbi:recombinase family protein [Herbaspirillum rubrisubalbicans]|uniref:Recombinase family protein n=1 Tax=Herbaspirillum rubrisubalbicans TaxID=80842 RepID=A0ABX9BUC5_9BURK|nr:recombinase family protein [Herbaspirillum rubrisubalbicans]RAM61230.1 hypothetical protein RB24_26240 [Herbaspirillum rubrisubalbicans]